MTHEQLVARAGAWLRQKYSCGIILSEQACASGETPDVIGWKGKCRSVMIECKVSREDFLADRNKPWRKDPMAALGSERIYAAPAGIIQINELPKGWGLLESNGRKLSLAVKPSRNCQRTNEGLLNEKNLLLASLRRVEIRIEPQTITEFLKWQNRMARYNGGTLPSGIVGSDNEANLHLQEV